MKSSIKIFLVLLVFCSTDAVYAQTSDSSNASNSDNSNKVRHGGAPGSTASYTVHDGEVRPVSNVKARSNAKSENNDVNNNATPQAANASAAKEDGQVNNADSASQANANPVPPTEGNKEMPAANNCHFCWGWLGLLGLLGLAGLKKKRPEQA